MRIVVDIHKLCLFLSLLFVLAGCRPIQPIPSPAGRLAYIGGDGNIYVTTGVDGAKLAMTRDATVPAEGNGRSYHRLAWSPEGQLAFAAVERGLGVTRSEVFVAWPGQPAQQVADSAEHFVIYLYWSPQPCPQQPTCRALAYLIEGEAGVHLHLVELWPAEVRDSVLGAAQPFYFSWSADGRQMLWHRSGSRRFHADASLTRFDLAGRSASALSPAPGYFLAPAWAPDGRHWLDVVEAGDEMALRLVDAQTGAETILTKAQYDIAFVWSPDSGSVAYAVRTYGADPYLGPIHRYAVANGTTQRLTDEGLYVQAFFWSPDGRRIGYIHWLGVTNESWAQWRVYDLVAREDRGFNAFNPSFPMRMVIGSFNQFAQSHRFWSPDGRYLTYADRDRHLVERVWLVDTQAEKGTPPLLIDEGSIAFWSWQ